MNGKTIEEKKQELAEQLAAIEQEEKIEKIKEEEGGSACKIDMDQAKELYTRLFKMTLLNLILSGVILIGVILWISLLFAL